MHDLVHLVSQVVRGQQLAQHPVARLGPEQQLAWLVAYNEGFFDACEGPQVQRRLAWLLARAASAGPGLSAGRDAWREGIAAWAAEAGDEPPA